MKKKISPRNKKRLKNKLKNEKEKSETKKNSQAYITYLLTIAYDGSYFGGFAKQKFSNTIEEHITTNLNNFLNENIKLISASRTDAKVHALDQKIMFKTTQHINNSKFYNYMSEHLHKGIDILDIEKKSSNFHSRYDAKNKTYFYKIHTTKNVFLQNYSYYLNNDNLDVKKINEICSLFVGEKNFIGFCSPKKDSDNTIRTINSFIFKQVNEVSYTFEINANGFLYNMVRIIVGSVLNWYNQNKPIENIEYIINSEEKTKLQTKAPPQGLYLAKINYD